MSNKVTRTIEAAAAIKITSEALDDIRCAGGVADPLEACGLLLGLEENGVRFITKAVETRNVHPAPATHFEVEPKALIDAYRDERNGGLRLLGYFHSHPTGDPSPSMADQRMAPGDGRIWAIEAGGEVRLWKDERDGFAPLPFETVDL